MHLVGEPELLRERPRHTRVMLDHPVHLPVARDQEFETEPEAVQGRVAGAEEPDSRGSHPPALHVVLVLDRLRGDVVAEPLGLLVSVGMAADVDEEGGVVDDRPLLLVKPEPLGQPHRDQALAQDVLHRLPEAVIDS